MERKEKYFSPEISNGGIQQSHSYASSHFVTSINNLKYLKLGYAYFMLLPFILYTQVENIATIIHTLLSSNFHTFLIFLGLLSLLMYACFILSPRSTYLVDFFCYLPPNELKISRSEYIKLAQKSGHFDAKAIEFQRKVLKDSGLRDETYLPRVVFQPDYRKNLNLGLEEAAVLMFDTVDNLLSTTGVQSKDINILIVNCGILNSTPSLSAMVINRYKFSHRVQSYNLGGMGCAAGITALDLAHDLLNAYPGSYVLIVSTEVISFTWYNGNELSMVLQNCFLRTGASAVLLSNHRLQRWRAKYQLKNLVRTHKGMDDRSYNNIQLKEDSQGKQGLSVSADVVEVGGHAVRAHIATLGPLVLPLSEKFNLFRSLFFLKRRSTKTHIPNYKLALDHVCIHATSKRVLDEMQNNLDLTDEYMEASRKTLERFGNTSSSNIWYELAFLEAKKRIKKGDRVWQLAMGSGLKCNSVV